MALWDRQPGESDAQFAGFAAYRDLPATGRSIERAREACGKGRGASSTFEQWSSRHRWVERVAAYDGWVDSIRRDERERGFRSEERLRFQRLGELREAEFALAMKAIHKATRMVDWPLARVRKVDTDEGTVTVVEPARWQMRDAAKLFLVGSNRARLVLDAFGDPARAPTPEPVGAGTSDVERFLDSLVGEALTAEETPAEPHAESS